MKRSIAAAVSTLSLLAFSVGLSLPAAGPALADDPILGTVSGVAGYVSTLNSAYNSLIDFLTNPTKLSDLDQIKIAITQSASQITQQIDATVTGEAKSHCDTAIADFESITTDDQSHLATLQQEADQCVTMSMEEISAESSPQGIDGLGVALGTGGPIALATRQFEGQPTDIITSDIINAYKALLAKPQMQPTCGITPDNSDVYANILYPTTGPVPGTGGEAPVQGHGACFNYMAASPRVTDDITYYPSGAHTGQLPWDVTGDGQVDFCAEVFTCGHSHVTWPPRAQDYSVAYQQAMADTSFPVAEATLQRLLPVAGPAGQPVTMVAETATNQIYLPIDVFGVKPDGSLVQGVLNTSSDDPLGHASFGGWNPFDGPGAPVMSVASQATWDGRVQVFALDRTGLLYTRWQQNPRDDAHWSPWAQLNSNSNPLNSVSVARNSDGRLQIFGTTPSGTILSRYQYLNTDAEFAGNYEPTASGDIHPALASWTPWQTMSVVASMTQISAVKVGGQISLYGVSGSGAIYERHQNAANDEDVTASGNWSGWASVTGPSIGGNAIPPRGLQTFVDSGGQLNLLVTVNGSDQYQELVGTTGWVKIPGSMYGGFAVAKEPGGAGADEMVGVGKDGTVFATYSLGILSQVNGAWEPDNWHDWSPVGGTTLRAYVAGPDAGPVLNPLQSGTGQVTLTWTDMSTNEDNFAVFRYTDGGAYVSEASDQSSVSKSGTGEVNTFTDTSPTPVAPCYQVDSYDFAGSFVGASDIVCPPSPTVSKPDTQFGTVGTPVSLQIQASDPNGEELKYLATGLPDGVIIRHKSGLITGTPTRANPDGGGIGLDFEVTVYVTNADGFTTTTTFSWLIAPAQLLGNRDFENGTAPWIATPAVIDLASAAEPAAVGSYMAWLDGYGSPHTDTLSQTVTLPTGSAHYDLNFWLHIDTQELTTSVAFDHLWVQVLDQSGNVLGTLATYSNLNSNTGYALQTLNMATYAGQTVTIQFTGTEDINNKTDFVIDYTSLKVY